MDSELGNDSFKAAEELAQMGQSAIEPLIKMLPISSRAHYALRLIGGETVFKVLCREIETGNWRRIEAAARALGKIGDKRALEPLRLHIFWLYFMLPAIIFSLPFMKKRAPATPDMSILNKKAIKLNIISKIIMFFPIIYSIFLPFNLKTLWFYTGLPIALVGTALYTAVWINLAIRPSGDKPATNGLYHFSRHPMYISAL